MRRLRAGIDDLSLWDDLRHEPEYARFLLDVHTLIASHPDTPETRRVLESVSRESGISIGSLEGLGNADPLALRTGQWLPKTIAARRMPAESQRVIDKNKQSDDVQGVLAKISDAIVPGIQEWPRVSKVLIPLYWGADKALPWIDRFGEITLDILHLEEAGAYFDEKGLELSNEMQRRYRTMHAALAGLKVALTRGGKIETLQRYTDEEQRMILMSGALLHDITFDLDQMMSLLKDPEQRKAKTAVGRLRNTARFTLGSLAMLARGTAEVIEGVTDEDGWREFNLLVAGGGRITLFGCSLAAGLGLFFPSINEYKQTGNPTLRNDLTYPTIAVSSLFRVMASSRGGSMSFGLPGVVARNNSYSNGIGLGIPYRRLIVAQNDVINGPALEVGLFPRAGAIGIFEVGAGAGVCVFHPELKFIVDPVEKASTRVSNAIEWALDWIKVPVTPVVKAVDAISKTLAHRLVSLWIGQEAPVVPERVPSAERRALTRIGASRPAVEKAGLALALIRAYRQRIDRRKTAGLPIASPENPTYAKMVAGFGEEEATRIIEVFLERMERHIALPLGHVTRLSRRPLGSPREERDLKADLRQTADDLREYTQMFAFADELLSQLLRDADWEAFMPGSNRRVDLPGLPSRTISPHAGGFPGQ